MVRAVAAARDTGICVSRAEEILVDWSSRTMMAVGAPSVIAGLVAKPVTWPVNRWDIDGPIKYWIISSKRAWLYILIVAY